VRDLSVSVSNYRATKSLNEYCKEQDVIGISDVDTRALTRILRDTGCINGVICSDPSKSDADLAAMAQEFDIVGKDLLKVVSRTDSDSWSEGTGQEWEFNPAAVTDGSKPYKVVAYDFGIKSNILRRLTSLGCDVTVIPADTPPEDVLAMNPDGVFFSNGPVSPHQLSTGHATSVDARLPPQVVLLAAFALMNCAACICSCYSRMYHLLSWPWKQSSSWLAPCAAFTGLCVPLLRGYRC
jgi:carbamoyl-phosphate synthase small subunit